LGETKEQLGEDGYPELVTAQKLNPNSSFVKATLSLYWRRAGHPEVALLYLHDLAQAEPNNSTWQIELAQTSVEMRDMISALSYFQSATNINPENASTWQKTAEFCLTYDIDLEGQGARAIDQAMKLAPDDAISQDLMGWKLLKSGDFDNAAKFFRKALSIDYNNARAHMHLGQALMNMDQKSEAQIELRKAIDISNDEGIKEMAQRLLEQLEN
jgi:Flp pilus assembly protein TadD